MLFRILVVAALLMASPAYAERWVTSWAGSVQGPYPVGNPSAQPELKFAIADNAAHDQTFRLIVRPSLWGRRARMRFSNAYGKQPLVIDTVFLGLQMTGAAVVPGSNGPVTFKTKKTVTIPPGGDAWSDSVLLPFAGNPDAPDLQGRKLAVSFHVAGDVPAITWHAKALQTSYITAAGAGALGEFEDESAFPNTTTSWFFLDALDMQAASDVSAVVCFGDSITDGTGSTLNGDDRYPDVLNRRLLAGGITMAVANAGIGGNQVIGPGDYRVDQPTPGGPSALQRLDRDIISLSGVSHVIWLEGINDFSRNGNASVDAVREGMKEGVKRLRAKIRSIKVIGATLTPVAGTQAQAHGSPDEDAKRRALNDFIRNSGGVFDGYVDFEKATIDRASGSLRAEFVPSSTIGGPGDKLHPNRAGYMAMGDAVDLRMLHLPSKPKPKPKPKPVEQPDDTGDKTQ